MIARLLLVALVAFPAFASAQRGGRPILERLEPTSGPPGTLVTIVGRGLNHVSQVRLGDAVLPVHERHPFRLVAEIPTGAASGPILLVARSEEFVGTFFRVTVAPPAPTVTGVSPASGPPGSEVVISGTNFSTVLAQNVVTLAGRPVVLRSASPSELRVIIPQDATSGAFTVRVGRAPEVTTPVFTVALGTAITSLEPAVGPVGTQLTIHGTGFSTDPRRVSVFFGRTRARVEAASDTQLVVRVPPRAVSGAILVDVRGGGRATSPMAFRVQPRPVLHGLEPAGGPPGTLVTLRGQHFGADASAVRVSIAGRPQVVRSVSPSVVQFEVVAGTVSGPLVLSVHELPAEQQPEFEGTGTLRVDSFAPTSGPVGTVVVIRGAGFAPTAASNVVSLSGVPAQVVSATPTTLQVRAPSAPAGPFEVRVGPAVVRTSQPFVVAQPPFIAGLEPRLAAPGDRVTIRGAHFGTNQRLLSVTLNGIPMQVFNLRDDLIEVAVPQGATSGRITVNVSLRGGTVTGEELQIDPNRAVYALEPASGYMGTEVVVRGRGFPASGIQVQFSGARPMPARRVSPVELRVDVPPDATTGPVMVLLPGRRSVPAGTFTVVATPDGVAITSVEPTCTHAGCVATLRGYGFRGTPQQARVRFLGEPVRVRGITPTTITIQLPNRVGNGRFELTLPGNLTAQSPAFLMTPR
ncbi:MAG: IPT/TIG domain-containing protein [Myxococcales bacterium]|nr:IPT/TIG domain-containing protein [Myxococcales bacterium]